jgi:hypothetical protein
MPLQDLKAFCQIPPDRKMLLKLCLQNIFNLAKAYTGYQFIHWLKPVAIESTKPVQFKVQNQCNSEYKTTEYSSAIENYSNNKN